MPQITTAMVAVQGTIQHLDTDSRQQQIHRQ